MNYIVTHREFDGHRKKHEAGEEPPGLMDVQPLFMAKPRTNRGSRPMRQWRQSGRIDILATSDGGSDFREAGCMAFSMILHAHFRSRMRADSACDGCMKITRRRIP
jgi:hypothetical protein